MKRDPSLVPLSHQHHNGLALCVLTDRSLTADESEENIGRLAGKIVARFEIELVNHFELEEQLLFPACPGSLAELIAELVADHREMERLVAGIGSNPTTDLLKEFIDLLRRHIRREESELFEQAQRLLPRHILDSLGQQFEEKAVRICLEP